MGKLGSFGGVTFTVSTNKVLNFNDFSRGGDARWSEHEVSHAKPISEFEGPGQESISLKISLKRSLGVDPEAELKKLRSFRDGGKVGSFVIGSKSISKNYWYISSIKEGDYEIDGKGRVLEINNVELSLKEYVKDAKAVTKAKPKTTTKKSTSSSKKVLGTITIKVGMLNCRASRSLKGRILKVLRKGQKYKVYGVKKTDISWYDLGGGKFCSAVSKYTSFKKA